METRILVVDDAEEHQLLVRKSLEKICRIVPAFTLAEADVELAKNSFGLILLDVGLPDGDGFAYFAKLRTQEHTADIPVIFVTTKSETPSEAMGFSLGAEDYITKPVDPLRLRSRIEGRLRLLSNRQRSELILYKGNLKISVSLQRVTILREGRETAVSLTPIEFKLLFYMLRHEDHVLSREQLLTAIWDNAAQVFDRTIDMHISKLRKKIALSDFQIKAVHGLGYRLSKTPPQTDNSQLPVSH